MKRALIGIFVLSFFLISPAAQAERPGPDPAVGAQAYKDNCARCHGPTGAGDGRDSRTMFPRPRPLSEGVFKFRTTASGTPPTDEDLFHTLSDGLPGSRMPEFQRLPEETRWQLVHYVKSLSNAFEQKPEPIPLGTDPGPAKANLARGKELYTQLGCNACHGNLGRGNGPSAPTLTDQWGNPIQAADLTQGWNYRSGSAARDILTRLITGIDGTPMPSYAEAVSSPAEVWDVAYYVHSLQEPARWSRKVEAAKLAETEDLPAAPDDARWRDAPRFDLRLGGNFYREGEILPASVPAISVQALYNERQVAFRLIWHDRTEDRLPQENRTPDAAGLIFLSDRKLKWALGSVRGWPYPGKEIPLSSLLWSADRASSEASYADGEWALVLKQPLDRAAPERFGVMVWDGSNSERDRHRANSNWIELTFTSSPA